MDPSRPIPQGINPFVDILPPCIDDVIVMICAHAVCGKLATLPTFASMLRGSSEEQLLTYCGRLGVIQRVSKKFYTLFKETMQIIATSITKTFAPPYNFNTMSHYARDLCIPRGWSTSDPFLAWQPVFRRVMMEINKLKKVGHLITADTRRVIYKQTARSIEIDGGDSEGFSFVYRKNEKLIRFTVQRNGAAVFSAFRTYDDDVYTYCNFNPRGNYIRTIKMVDDKMVRETNDELTNVVRRYVKGESTQIHKESRLVYSATKTTLYTFYWPSGKREIVVDDRHIKKYNEDGKMVIYCKKSELGHGTHIASRMSSLGQNVSLVEANYLDLDL